MSHTKKLIWRVILTNNNFNIISTKILKEIYIPKPSDSNRHVSSTPKSRHQDKKFGCIVSKKEPEGALGWLCMESSSRVDSENKRNLTWWNIWQSSQ